MSASYAVALTAYDAKVRGMRPIVVVCGKDRKHHSRFSAAWSFLDWPPEDLSTRTATVS
jgi:hypothetical protein